MNPRKILGVGENASQDEIQRAYRKKAQKHHPDMGGDAWAFQQVQEAYQTLTGVAAQSTTGNRPSGTPDSSSNSDQTSSQSATEKATTSKTSRTTKSPQPNHSSDKRHWWQFFVGELPLQNETTTFILINCLDIFMTYLLLRRGAIEANPIANAFYQIWNFNGMIFFKLVTVAAVCVIAQVVAWKKLSTARYLLIFGSAIVGAVVIYSIWLFMTKVN